MTLAANDPITTRIEQDPFAKRMGIAFEEVRPGYGRTSMTLAPDMLNFHGIPHGGAIFTLADAAFAAASNSHGQTAVALSVTINFLAAAESGSRLIAEAQELRKGHRSGFYQIAVKKETGDLIATCQAVVYRKQESFAERLP